MPKRVLLKMGLVEADLRPVADPPWFELPDTGQSAAASKPFCGWNPRKEKTR